MTKFEWPTSLVAAANNDNVTPGRLCETASSRELLSAAPPGFREHAQLAIEDFNAGGAAPLVDLRSDSVANRFRVRIGHLNVFVARMTVPGGPWPGHFGLEALCFSASKAPFPSWFPQVGSSPLMIGTMHTASNGFLRGQGAVLFPELLALRAPLERQAFGVVFMDRLTVLYAAKVAPVLKALGIPNRQYGELYSARRLAFLAHEWGHLRGSALYEKTVQARRRRLIAVISELYADLASLSMLLHSGVSTAIEAAEILLFDRIFREAWLPRAHRQVDSIAARHLLVLLNDSGFAAMRDGQVKVSLNNAMDRLEQELQLVGAIEADCSNGDDAPARHYLEKYGWELERDGCHVNLFDKFAGAVKEAAAQT